MNKIILLVLAIVISLLGYTLWQLNNVQKQHQQQLEQLTASPSEHSDTQVAHDEGEYEVALVMAHFQRHFNKLWFAGINSNWELAGFYIHELEESMEELESENVMDEGINLSEMVKLMGISQLEKLEEAVEAKSSERFEADYVQLMNACNGCHAASSHAFIKIIRPTTPALDNQLFSIAE